jgi:hypothetical protein
MKRAVLVVGVGLALALLGACSSSSNSVTGSPTGSGDVATESRPVSGFTAVSLSGAGHLIVQQTGVESLQITAEESLLPLIRSDVVDGTLILGFQPGTNVSTTREVVYRLTAAQLTALEASGASRVELSGLATVVFGTVLSGASSMTASGTADTHALVVSGASRLEAPDLATRVVTATLSGASYGLVRVSESLTVTASGASTLEYHGDPVVLMNVSGDSAVRRVGP